MFGLLANVMKRPDLIADPLFQSNALRVQNHAQLKPILEEWLTDKTIDETVDMLLAQGIPAAPINTIDRVVKDPHIAVAREMFLDVEHPIAGKVKITGNPIKLGVDKPQIHRCSPLLGQDNELVLKNILKMSQEQIATLKDKKIL